jgi:polar amino acid transport system substrate-binding protein
MTTLPRRSAIAAVLVLAVSALAAGCGSSSATSAASPTTPAARTTAGSKASSVPAEVASLHAMLPASIRSAGTITVATNAPFPPFEMFTSPTDQTIIGMEPDIGHLIGDVLGVKVVFKQQPFAGLIPGLQSGKYEMVMAGLSDTAQREKVVTMIDFDSSGQGILVAAGNPDHLSTLLSLCGHTVAVQSGSNQVQLIGQENTKCAAAGKPAENLLQLPDFNDLLLAVTTGRAQAVLNTLPTIGYSLKTAANASQFQLLHNPAAPNGYDPLPGAIAVPKGDTAFANAIVGALNVLRQDGAYQAALAKWGVRDIAVTHFTIDDPNNNGTS